MVGRHDDPADVSRGRVKAVFGAAATLAALNQIAPNTPIGKFGDKRMFPLSGPVFLVGSSSFPKKDPPHRTARRPRHGWRRCRARNGRAR